MNVQRIHWSDQGKCPTCGHAMQALDQYRFTDRTMRNGHTATRQADTTCYLVTDIAGVQSDGDYVLVDWRGTTRRSFISHPISFFERCWPAYFMRVSRSQLVAREMVAKLVLQSSNPPVWVVVLSDGHSYAASRRQAKAIKQWADGHVPIAQPRSAQAVPRGQVAA